MMMILARYIQEVFLRFLKTLKKKGYRKIHAIKNCRFFEIKELKATIL